MGLNPSVISSVKSPAKFRNAPALSHAGATGAGVGTAVGTGQGAAGRAGRTLLAEAGGPGEEVAGRELDDPGGRRHPCGASGDRVCWLEAGGTNDSALSVLVTARLRLPRNKYTCVVCECVREGQKVSVLRERSRRSGDGRGGAEDGGDPAGEGLAVDDEGAGEAAPHPDHHRPAAEGVHLLLWRGRRVPTTRKGSVGVSVCSTVGVSRGR